MSYYELWYFLRVLILRSKLREPDDGLGGFVEPPNTSSHKLSTPRSFAPPSVRSLFAFRQGHGSEWWQRCLRRSRRPYSAPRRTREYRYYHHTPLRCLPLQDYLLLLLYPPPPITHRFRFVVPLLVAHVHVVLCLLVSCIISALHTYIS